MLALIRPTRAALVYFTGGLIIIRQYSVLTLVILCAFGNWELGFLLANAIITYLGDGQDVDTRLSFDLEF